MFELSPPWPGDPVISALLWEILVLGTVAGFTYRFIIRPYQAWKKSQEDRCTLLETEISIIRGEEKTRILSLDRLFDQLERGNKESKSDHLRLSEKVDAVSCGLARVEGKMEAWVGKAEK